MATMLVTKVLLVVSILVHVSVTATTLCKTTLPGLSSSMITSGVDITTLDLLPIAIGLSIKGKKKDIIQLSNEFTTDWLKIPNYSGKYCRPKQVNDIVTIGSSSNYTVTKSIDLYRSYQQVKRKMVQDVGLSSTSYAPFAFSMTPSYIKMQNSIMGENHHVIKVTAKATSYKVFFKDSGSQDFLLLSFQEKIDFLQNKTYKSNADAFRYFIQEYGTHYIKWGEFGGGAGVQIETKSSYAWGKPDKKLKEEAAVVFNRFMKRDNILLGIDINKTVDSKEFEDSRTYDTTFLYGAMVDDEGGIVPGGGRAPVLLNVGMSPIYKLITNNTLLRDEMKTAIGQYVMRNFLNELDRKLNNAKTKYSNDDFKDLMERSKHMKQADIIDVDFVKALNDRVVYLTEIPSWFYQNTHVCLKYKTEDHNGECNGRSYKLCSKPNDYTPIYSDTTVNRTRVTRCQLSWGITSPKSYSWFKNVQMCVLWFLPGGKWNTRCGLVDTFAGPAPGLSAAAGNSTYSFFWKIKPPVDPPLWMSKTQLCIKTRCHDGGLISICAKPGLYTPEFHDPGGNCKSKTQWSWQVNN